MPAVPSLGKLCTDHGYSHEWVSGQKPHLSKNGKLRRLLENKNDKGFLQKTHWRSSTSCRKVWWLDKGRSQKVLNEGCESRDNHRYAVVVQDLATSLIQTHPCKTKPAHETENCVKICGAVAQTESCIHTHNSVEVGRACEDLSWNYRTSAPHRSETDYCQDLLTDKKTPHERRFGEPFEGPDHSVRSNGWICYDFFERPIRIPPVWKERITKNIPRVRTGCGWNPKRRCYGCEDVVIVLRFLGLIVVVLRCWRATHSLPTEMGTGVLWVLTRTHPCDDPPRQDGEPSERQLVLACWLVRWLLSWLVVAIRLVYLTEELGKKDASEFHARRLNAWELLVSQKVFSSTPLLRGNSKITWKRSWSSRIETKAVSSWREGRSQRIFPRKIGWVPTNRSTWWRWSPKWHLVNRRGLHLPSSHRTSNSSLRVEKISIPLFFWRVQDSSHKLDVLQEKRIKDYWNVFGYRTLPDSWTRFTKFTLPSEKHLPRKCGLVNALRKIKQLPDLIVCGLRFGLTCRKQSKKERKASGESKDRQRWKTERHLLYWSWRWRSLRDREKCKKQVGTSFRSCCALQDGDKKACLEVTGCCCAWENKSSQENKVCLQCGSSWIHKEAFGINSSAKSRGSCRREKVQIDSTCCANLFPCLKRWKFQIRAPVNKDGRNSRKFQRRI